jgi:hypothetical protein
MRAGTVAGENEVGSACDREGGGRENGVAAMVTELTDGEEGSGGQIREKVAATGFGRDEWKWKIGGVGGGHGRPIGKQYSDGVRGGLAVGDGAGDADVVATTATISNEAMGRGKR